MGMFDIARMSIGKMFPRTMRQSSVSNFSRERVSYFQGSSVVATTLYAAYADWCGKNEVQPVDAPDFYRQMDLIAPTRAKIAGRIRYVHIALKDPA